MKKTLHIFIAALSILGAAVSCEEKPNIEPSIRPSEPESGVVNISNIDELNTFLADGKKQGVLTCDIDTKGKALTLSAAFKGELDGAGHSIKGLSGSDHLSGINNGTFKNLTLEGALSPTTNIFGVVANYNNGTISNVTCKVDISYNPTGTGNYIGGLVGQMVKGSLSGSSFDGSITVGKGCTASVGGLVGLVSKDSGSFGEGCSVNGKISNSDSGLDRTGMVIGTYENNMNASVVGSSSDPIMVSGSINPGSGEIAIHGANVTLYAHGKTGWAADKCKLYVACETVVEECIFISEVRATTSTVVVAWTNDQALAETIKAPHAGYSCPNDMGKAYRVELYSDYSCTDLLIGWNVPANHFTESYPPRWVFSGLTPGTKYYVKIHNTTDGKMRQLALAVKTEDALSSSLSMAGGTAKAGDCILAESFDRLLWGGDMACMASGYSRTDRSSLTSLSTGTASGDDPVAQDSKNYIVTGSVEMGLFNTLAGVVKEMGLGEWAWTADDNTAGTILARPGYVKVGANSKHACLITPTLSTIGSGNTASITVKFKMAAYGSTELDDAERVMSVRLLSGGSRAASGLLSGYSTDATSSEIAITGNGEWKEYSVNFDNVSSISRIAFGGTRPGSGVQSRFHIDDIVVIVNSTTSSGSGNKGISGHIKDSDGKPCSGISVSDGFTVAITDSDGYYTLEPTSDTWYIYYSIPEYAKIEKDSYGRPAFFTRYNSAKKVYDFTITRQAVETEFALFAMADPQAHYAKRSPQTSADTDRFKLESVPAINAQIAASKLPCYGVTLGDIVYSEGSRNSNNGLSVMRTNFSMVNMPVFQTMGNHDFTYFYGSSNPLTTDETSSTMQLKVERKFEDCFGPINYSFNRGNVHVVCMKDIYFNSTTDASNYKCAFTDEQWEWFKADLANVPKSKAIILCVHIPLAGCSAATYTHVMDVMNLMKQYTNSTIFSGHTHYYRGMPNCNSTGMYEHIHSAVCGQWWWSNIEGDGCPNGYTIYDINGTTIKDAYFIGVNDKMNTRDYQMRIYKGNITTGGSTAYFNWGLDEKTLLINVFSGDERWKVQVYENGVLKGNATLMANSKKTLSVTKGNTYDVPAGSNQDWWAIGYHIGVVGRGTGTSTAYYTNMFHMWKYTMSDANAAVKVVATDPYGNQYTCTEVITSGTSYPSYVKAAH